SRSRKRRPMCLSQSTIFPISSSFDRLKKIRSFPFIGGCLAFQFSQMPSRVRHRETVKIGHAARRGFECLNRELLEISMFKNAIWNARALLVLPILSSTAQAQELKALALQSPQIVLKEFAPAFERRTGYRIAQIASPNEMPLHIKQRT